MIYEWIIQIVLIVFFTLLSAFLAHRFVIKLLDKTKKTKYKFDDLVFESLIGPLRLLIWSVGLSLAVHLVVLKINSDFVELVNIIRYILIILIINWFLFRLVGLYEKSFDKDKKKVDLTIVKAFAKIIRATIVITTSLIVLQTIGISISGLLAFGGVGGLAVGMAAKDMIANFFGGLTIYIDRPFKVGDWVRSSEKEIEGVVEDIGWRQTTIRTFDKRPLYIPNATFTNITVENPSRMSHRRIYEYFGLRYDDIEFVPQILKEVKEYLILNDDIDKSETIIVNLNEFNSSSIDFFIYVLTKTTKWTEFHVIKEKVLLNIAKIIERNNAQIAFPTTTLKVERQEILKETNKF